MTVKELKELANSDMLVVRSGYNGKILTSNYNPKKHEETIGNRKVISIWTDIKTHKSPSTSSAYSVLCCYVCGDIERANEITKNKDKG